VELLIATRSTHRILGAPRLGIARIAKETGLTWQTVYRIKEDPAGSETALAAWEL
jgi:Helix-turn-helix domain of resolvase